MTAPWWKGAVVYQVYPRSFCDSDGDGIGDLPGLLSKLDYIQALGADAVWLSPVHPSPNKDFGYDVSDFEDVAPQMGGMAAFEALTAAMHQRGLKLIMDEVLAHTSDRHPWFAESLKGDEGNKPDWYVWADTKDDGGPPNNWLSVFGGAAWSYHPKRRKHYFHKFLRSQPKLNWRDPGAKAAALEVLRFWLKKGVDGFRLDVANSFLHDDKLRDNPAIPPALRGKAHWGHAPNMQKRIHDSNLPENRKVLDEVRAVVEGFEDRFVFGEFSEEPGLIGEFVGATHGLQSGYTFTFLDDRSFSPQIFAAYYRFLADRPHVWPCVTFSNHDVVRTVTRYGGGKRDDALAKLALTLLFSLKGTILIYQGEELGLGAGDVAMDEVRDPVGELYFPFGAGRDPERTPMPWIADAVNAGFSTGKPWLPVDSVHAEMAANVQEGDPDSVLNFARTTIAARREFPALITGDIEILEANDQVLAFRRFTPEQSLLCVFNLSREPAVYAMPKRSSISPFEFGPGGWGFGGGGLTLKPLGAFIGQIG
ncbi:Oligo-1,6-glucosidase [Alphaproteobacteria bacterium SO-S41]|nr:Oligo-1,6-glucosidase [Alphaproteobacteria bacterium SO-S41]